MITSETTAATKSTMPQIKYPDFVIGTFPVLFLICGLAPPSPVCVVELLLLDAYAAQKQATDPRKEQWE
jgi:hypothetical protein